MQKESPSDKEGHQGADVGSLSADGLRVFGGSSSPNLGLISLNKGKETERPTALGRDKS